MLDFDIKFMMKQIKLSNLSWQKSVDFIGCFYPLTATSWCYIFQLQSVGAKTLSKEKFSHLKAVIFMTIKNNRIKCTIKEVLWKQSFQHDEEQSLQDVDYLE